MKYFFILISLTSISNAAVLGKSGKKIDLSTSPDPYNRAICSKTVTGTITLNNGTKLKCVCVQGQEAVCEEIKSTASGG